MARHHSRHFSGVPSGKGKHASRSSSCQYSTVSESLAAVVVAISVDTLNCLHYLLRSVRCLHIVPDLKVIPTLIFVKFPDSHGSRKGVEHIRTVKTNVWTALCEAAIAEQSLQCEQQARAEIAAHKRLATSPAE